jgi:hypothetical protein
MIQHVRDKIFRGFEKAGVIFESDGNQANVQIKRGKQ